MFSGPEGSLSTPLCVNKEVELLPKFKEPHLWIVSLSVLLIFRSVSGSLISEATLMALILHAVGFYFWVIPFFLGKEMALISYSDTFEKGTNDIARLLLFLAGIFGYIVALVV